MSNFLQNILNRFSIPLKFDRILLVRVLIFLILCQLMALMVATFIWTGDRTAPFLLLLTMTEITAMSIAPVVTIAATFTVNYIVPRFSPLRGFLLFLSVTMTATLVGAGICYLASWVFLNGAAGISYRGDLPVIAISAELITISTTIISFVFHLREEKTRRDTAAAMGKSPEAPSESVVFRADDGHRNVAVRDIIYLSAAGEKTVVHTPNEDIVISQYLGQLAEKTPEPIIRCHRSYAFNRDWCVRIAGAAGGRYTVFLKDDDETNLPVGRRYAPAVKEKLGMNRTDSAENADVTTP